MNASNINCILYNTTSQKFGIIKNYYYCNKKKKYSRYGKAEFSSAITPDT